MPREPRHRVGREPEPLSVHPMVGEPLGLDASEGARTDLQLDLEPIDARGGDPVEQLRREVEARRRRGHRRVPVVPGVDGLVAVAVEGVARVGQRLGIPLAASLEDVGRQRRSARCAENRVVVDVAFERDDPPLLSTLDRAKPSRGATGRIDDRERLALGETLRTLEHRKPSSIAERLDDEAFEAPAAGPLEDHSPRLDEGRVDHKKILRLEVRGQIGDPPMLHAIAMHHEHPRRVARLRGLGRDPRRIERVVEILAREPRVGRHRFTRRAGR